MLQLLSLLLLSRPTAPPGQLKMREALKPWPPKSWAFPEFQFSSSRVSVHTGGALCLALWGILDF